MYLSILVKKGKNIYRYLDNRIRELNIKCRFWISPIKTLETELPERACELYGLKNSY